MTRRDIKTAYLDWMVDIVCKNRYEGNNSFRKLLEHLHSIEFTYRMLSDGDRARDGVSLRRRFALSIPDIPYDWIIDCLDKPCSVLEMILALAIRCEEDIMNNPQVGDRTGQWFWKMITNMGLGGMTDRLYDKNYVDEVVTCFLERKYDPDGRGGLFRIQDSECDIRKISIWVQMCYYLDRTI